MNRKFAARLAAVALTLSLSLTACTSDSAMTTNDNAAVSSKADAALKEIQGKVLSKGPHGEEPSTRDAVMLSDAEVAQVKAKGTTTTIVIDRDRKSVV